MATWQEQMDTAEIILKQMAGTEGKLSQSVAEWRLTLESACSAGMMLEARDAIIKILDPSGQLIDGCIKSIQNIDKIYTIKTIGTIAKLGKLSPPNVETVWEVSHNKGKESAKAVIKRANGGYGNFNNFNVQIQILDDIRKTIESIQSHINIIKASYGRFDFQIREMEFMEQYADKISQDCFQPRIGDFSNIYTSLEDPKKIITDKILELELAKMAI